MLWIAPAFTSYLLLIEEPPPLLLELELRDGLVDLILGEELSLLLLGV